MTGRPSSQELADRVLDALATLRHPWPWTEDAIRAAADHVEAEIARLREGHFEPWEIEKLRSEFKAAEAEIARLEQEREKFRQIASDEMSLTEQQRARAEAAEAEVARLRDGLRRIQSMCGHHDAAEGCRLILVESRALLAEDGAA